jgi:hypothetical protein
MNTPCSGFVVDYYKTPREKYSLLILLTELRKGKGRARAQIAKWRTLRATRIAQQQKPLPGTFSKTAAMMAKDNDTTWNIVFW